MACVIRTFRSSTGARCLLQRRAVRRHASSSAEASSPLLAKIKDDLKPAMRAKDIPRLNVIRAIISETNQAASRTTPIRSDMQLLALLRKRKISSLAAAKEAEQVGRTDLKEKQEKEVEILDEYAGSVKMVSGEEMKELAEHVVTGLIAAGKTKPRQGDVMKELMKSNGPLDGKPLERKQLSQIVAQAVEAKS